MFIMVQKCSYYRVLDVFFKEPTSIHFIKEISRKIKLAPTSVRNIVKGLLKEGMIVKKKASPFDGFVANRDNERFIFCKRAFNILSLFELKEEIKRQIYPKSIILFGSYSMGEDVESSDIDILVLTNVEKAINLKKFEEFLNRKINLIFLKEINDLDKPVAEKAKRGIYL